MTEITTRPFGELLHRYPYASDFFSSMGLKEYSTESTPVEIITQLTDSFITNYGMEREQILANFISFISEMEALKDGGQQLQSLTLIGGHDKNGRDEECSISFHPGDIICIVGPTGSGKSRLLADIECLAQKDTPTGRQILVNDAIPEKRKRFSVENKLVAQLSQNMNFVMDLSVGEFITMHAESRLTEDTEAAVREIIECANDLAGEPFCMETSVTQLSGGQSRALMIADTALLSPLPIVLIDEIENAGVNREKALSLLIREEKIVFISTHDPILALLGARRIVIRNGGIAEIIETSEEERKNLAGLQLVDRYLTDLRERIRSGERIESGLEWLHLVEQHGNISR